MSNQSIFARIQWNIPLNHDSDTDSTVSDIDTFSQSILKPTSQNPGLSKKNSPKKGLLTSNLQANNLNFEKHSHEQHENLLCRHFENDTCLTEIVGRSWAKTGKENSKPNAEIINKNDTLECKQVRKQSIDKNMIAIGSMMNNTDNFHLTDSFRKQWTTESNFESNMCLTEIIGKSWSEEIHENVWYSETIPDVKHPKNMISTKPYIDEKSNISTLSGNNNEIEFCSTKMVDEEWRKDVSKGEPTLGEFTHNVVADISNSLFDDEEEKKNKAGSYKDSLLDKSADEFNGVSSETYFEQSKNMIITEDNVLGSNLLERENHLNADFSEYSPKDVTKINFSQNNKNLEGLIVNFKDVHGEKTFNVDYHALPEKNTFYSKTMKSNDRFSNNQEKKVHKIPQKKFKPTIFSEPRFSKVNGATPRNSVPKKISALKNQNCYIKRKTSYKVKENEFIPPKEQKKIKLISANKICMDYSKSREKSFEKTPEEKKIESHKRKFKELKDVKDLVKIGSKLDKIRTCINKWLIGDSETTVSRKNAVNMLDYVRYTQSYLKTVHDQKGKKPPPIKKLICAASILELQIGKAISDADLLYTTEQLNRLVMLKGRDEIESDDCSEVVVSQQSCNNGRYHNPSKAKVGNIQNQANLCEDVNIHNKIITKGLKKLAEDTLPTTTTNLKSVLKNAGKNYNTEKKCLNFSDHVEYFDVSQKQENRKSNHNINSNMCKIVLKSDETLEALHENIVSSRIRNNSTSLNSDFIESEDNTLSSHFKYLNLSQDNSMVVTEVSDSRVKSLLNSSYFDSEESQVKSSSSETKKCFSNNQQIINLNSFHLESASLKTSYLSQCEGGKLINLENNETNKTLASKQQIFFNNEPLTYQLVIPTIATEQDLSSHNSQENFKLFSLSQIKGNEKFSTCIESTETLGLATRNKSVSKDNFSDNILQNKEQFSFNLTLDSNRSTNPVFQQNNSALLSHRLENMGSKFSKSESIGSTIIDLNQNNMSVLKEKYLLNNILKNIDSYASNLGSISSLEARSVDYLSKSYIIKFNGKEESWRQVTIMGVKSVRMKSAGEYHLVENTEDDEDWVSGW